MDKRYFLKLLDKYLKGETTPEEQAFVVNYYNLFRQEPDVMKALSPGAKEALKQELRRDIEAGIDRETASRKKLIPLHAWIRGAAAAAILAALFTTGLFFLRHRPHPATAAILARPDGKPGENRFMRLPDGSTVILSHGSRLRYPSSFEGRAKREVYLEGQAFFDIRHEAAQAFVVHTGNLRVTVLGTAFNVRAFPGDAEITVTVKRGKVSVSDPRKTLGIIAPDQQMIYRKQPADALRKTVHADSCLAWKTEDLRCDNLTLDEAAALLGERFNVQIMIGTPATGSKRFTTTFPGNESLEDALKSICEFNEVHYRYDREKATVRIYE